MQTFTFAEQQTLEAIGNGLVIYFNELIVNEDEIVLLLHLESDLRYLISITVCRIIMTYTTDEIKRQIKDLIRNSVPKTSITKKGKSEIH